jgi:hypothetical protein
MTERKPPDVSWESFVERQIREAQEAGEFDNLPGFGRPLPDHDEPYDTMSWVKEKIKRENLSLLPPALQIRLDVEKTVQAALDASTELEVRRAIVDLNQRIRQANFACVWGPPSTTMPLDVESLVAEWHRRRCNRSGP